MREKRENLFHWQYCATQKAAMRDLTTTTGCKTHFIWVGMKNYKSFRGLYLLGIFRRLSKCHCKTTKRRGHSMNSTARRSLKRHGFIMEQEFGGKHRWFYKPGGGGIFSRYFQLPPTALTTTFALCKWFSLTVYHRSSRLRRDVAVASQNTRWRTAATGKCCLYAFSGHIP